LTGKKARNEIHKIEVENRCTIAPQSCTLVNMNELTDTRTRESLISEIAALKRQLAEVQAVILKLSGQIEELRRSGKRQAVPFAQREHVEHPKKRGCKHGKGQFKNREKPKTGQVSEPVILRQLFAIICRNEREWRKEFSATPNAANQPENSSTVHEISPLFFLPANVQFAPIFVLSL